MGRLQSVQVLRFVAALGVVLMHAHIPGARIGAGGVDLFFVISGFIITRVGAGKTPGRFLADRARRIYPLFWVCTLPWAVLAAFAGLLSPERTLTSLSLWPVFSDYFVPYLKSGWTLSFEMLFYLAFTLAIWRPATARWLVVAYGLALAAGLAWRPPLLAFVGSPIILEFLFGVVIARAPRRFGPAALAAGLAGALASVPMADRLIGVGMNMDGWRALYAGLPAALILYGAIQLEEHVKGWRIAVYLGDASYSLYLTNLLVMELADAPAVKVAAALAAGVLTYRYVEQPLLRALRRPRLQNVSVTP